MPQDQALLSALRATREQLDKAIASLSAPPRKSRVRVIVDIGNSILHQSILMLASNRVSPELIIPEAPVLVSMPQIKTTFQTTWAAQYRLSRRSELAALVQHVFPVIPDPANISQKLIADLTPDNKWTITIK